VAYDLTDNEPVDLHPEASLRRFAEEVLLALGASREEAEIIADGVITASLWYHPGQGQGLEKLLRYRRRLREGGLVADAPMRWEREGPAYGLLDAARGFGYVAAQRAMLKAVDKAQQTGIAMVWVRNSNHFGIAGYHALAAARRGMIGWSMTNARSEMAPWGSAKPVLATNPWGLAVPTPGSAQGPIVLDMALTMSGKGMMRWYLEQGRSMPASWALTPAGEVTTDPAAAMDGPMLPIGEYKGYGLSLITDVLTGVMSGAKFGLSVFQDEQHYDVGHLMMAFDPTMFMPRERFDERLEQLIAEVKGAPPIDPERPVLLPGDLEHARSERRRREGVPVARASAAALRELAQELGVPCPL
jgi:LDH2 family malate/lactate/ureidoglycolate dehydrogenase